MTRAEVERHMDEVALAALAESPWERGKTAAEVDREVEEAFDSVLRFDTLVEEVIAVDAELDGDITWRWRE